MIHWSLPIEPLLIDTLHGFETVRNLLEDAAVCAIDAEWPPEQTGLRPVAATVQLALFGPSGVRAIVLDLQAIPDKAPINAVLRQVFRQESTIKVGYGLRADLAALSIALGSRGGCAVATVHPVVDIGKLHRGLRHKLTPGIFLPKGPGLSGIVEAQLGHPLDKSQQCSSWGVRPLTQKQLNYAATDVCCLLALLNNFILCSCPIREDDDHQAIISSGKATSSTAETPRFAWTASQLQWVCDSWGERWEMVEGRVRCTGGLEVEIALRNKKKSKNGSFIEKTITSHFPLHVPWMDSNRQLTGPPRFLADVMVQGLARQLRLWGIDAEAVDTAPKTQRHVVHRQLVERAAEEKRVILTRDVVFLRRGLSDQAYCVVAESKREQVSEVVKAFALERTVTHEALLSRCPRCNGEFLETPVSGAALSDASGVPQAVRARVDEFWVCSRCGVAYWQGSMYARAMERLTAALDKVLLDKKDTARIPSEQPV